MKLFLNLIKFLDCKSQILKDFVDYFVCLSCWAGRFDNSTQGRVTRFVQNIIAKGLLKPPKSVENKIVSELSPQITAIDNFGQNRSQTFAFI